MDVPEGTAKPAKPLGRKGYGSTPHLPGSRTGAGDWTIHEGQAHILTRRARRGDRIIVTEKLDGSCSVLALHGGRVVPVTRAGYHARDSIYRMHHLLADWAEARAGRIEKGLEEGFSFAGEWLLQAHGTRYEVGDADALFVCFAAFDGKRRLAHDEARQRMAAAGLVGAAVLSDGSPLSQEAALELLGERGFHGAVDPVEGAVWCCEADGRFDFIAKHVVHGKQDGTYLPRISGGEPVWNMDPALVGLSEGGGD